MQKQINNNIKHFLLSSLVIAALSACGGGGGSTTTEDPYVPPAPTTPPADEFPSQLAKPNTMVINDSGSLIIAESGLSLYTFDNDMVDTSTCDGTSGDFDTCAGLWPPLLADDGAIPDESMTLITRSDNAMQWAYQGQPLYHWYQDSAQGDVGGDGINGVWHLARPLPLISTDIAGMAAYVGSQTIASVSDAAGVLTPMRIDKSGFTLYTFDNDPIDDSACAGDCINIWPPLLADAGAKAM